MNEDELRKHDKALSAAINYFNDLMPLIKEEAKIEFQARWRQLEMSYLEMMDVVLEEFGLPEDWE